MVNIYIATSIKALKRQNGTVGFVLEAEGHKDRTLTQFGSVRDATANQAVLLALKYALKRINTKTELTIWTDNTYIRAAFEQGWLEGWVKNGWKTHKDKMAANREEWECVLKELDGVIPQFRIKEPHPYRHWLQSEVERRAKKYV